MKSRVLRVGLVLLIVLAVAAVYTLGNLDGMKGKNLLGPVEAQAAGGAVKSPTGVAPNRYIYYPGTEELGKEEIRLIALGTGMPAARRSQAATCWLVELGNGDKFLFDIGTGANANMAALMIPFDFLTKVFLTHLRSMFTSSTTRARTRLSMRKTA